MKTAQSPIHSGFGADTTAAEIAAGHDLTGKVAVVTGGTSGLGYATATALAAQGATVVVGARSADRLHGKFTFFPLDLADPASVDKFSESFLNEHGTLHFLFNNAGIMRPPEFQRDGRGYELQFGVNHLGHFQLTGRLWPALSRGRARVVTLSSIGHRAMGVQLDDLNFDRHPYDKVKAYAQSKTANALFAVELDRIGQAHGVRAFAVHPGAILTDIFRYMPQDERVAWVQRVKNFKTPEQGAATSVWCALSDQLQDRGGVYCEDCDVAELVPDDSPATYGVRSFAVDPATATALWQVSEAATGIRYVKSF